MASKGGSRMAPLALEFMRKRSISKGGVKGFEGKSLKGDVKFGEKTLVRSERIAFQQYFVFHFEPIHIKSNKDHV